MTRILLMMDAFWPNVGGVEVLAGGLGEALVRRGHDVVVVTGRTDDVRPDDDTYLGIPVYRFPFAHAVLHRDVEAIARSMGRLGRLYSELQPDIYHIFPTGPAALFHLTAIARHPAPTLTAIQLAMPDRRDEGRLLEKLLGLPGWVTACSQGTLDHTRSLVPEIASRSSVVYNAIPVADGVPAPADHDTPILLCLGRVVEDKGFDVALSAFRIVLNELPDARLVVAGDGIARQNLERLAADLGVDDRVEFTGTVDREEVPSLIDAATLVIMPSRWEEAFGLVALEAAQRARPVVASRVGGLQEVVVDGETGLLVPREDPAALADAVVSLLRDPARAAELGRKARERAVRDFGWDRYVEAHVELYGRLIDEQPSGVLPS